MGLIYRVNYKKLLEIMPNMRDSWIYSDIEKGYSPGYKLDMECLKKDLKGRCSHVRLTVYQTDINQPKKVQTSTDVLINHDTELATVNVISNRVVISFGNEIAHEQTSVCDTPNDYLTSWLQSAINKGLAIVKFHDEELQSIYARVQS